MRFSTSKCLAMGFAVLTVPVAEASPQINLQGVSQKPNVPLNPMWGAGFGPKLLSDQMGCTGSGTYCYQSLNSGFWNINGENASQSQAQSAVMFFNEWLSFVNLDLSYPSSMQGGALWKELYLYMYYNGALTVVAPCSYCNAQFPLGQDSCSAMPNSWTDDVQQAMFATGAIGMKLNIAPAFPSDIANGLTGPYAQFLGV